MVNKKKARRVNALLIAHDLTPHDFKAIRGEDGMVFHTALDALDIATKLDTTGGMLKQSRKFGDWTIAIDFPVNTVTQRIELHERSLRPMFFHLGEEAISTHK